MPGHQRVADLCCVGAGRGDGRSGEEKQPREVKVLAPGVPPLPHDQQYLTSLELHAFLCNEDNNDHDSVEDGGHLM